jgi:hypothetical protein
MTTQFGNRVRVAVTNTGTGSAQLGSAVSGFKDFTAITSGVTVGYAIDDGTNWEVGTGVYTSGSPSNITRTNIEASTNGGAAISLSGSATLMLTQTAAPIYAPDIASGNVFNDVGRNVLHNALFRVQQRGVGAFTTNSAYTADRWKIVLVLDTVSFSIQTLSDAARTAIGDEAALYALQNVFTGNAGSTAYNYIVQPIEDLRRLSNKTVTVSFWANASATLKLGVNLVQNYGTGGSPSANAWAFTTGTAVTLSVNWTRYSATFALPSQSGKTLGTNNDHYLGLAFFYSCGSGNNALTGNIGVQSGTINLWGVQCEVGTSATQLEKIDVATDWNHCLRFYVSSNSGTWNHYGYIGGVQSIQASMNLPVPMRATPSLVNFNFTTSINVTTPTIAAQANTMLVMSATGAAAGPFGMVSGWNATADL